MYLIALTRTNLCSFQVDIEGTFVAIFLKYFL